ncbi:MAG: GNAT family N-acetyltransferase [Candidatus Bipolaricaulis sp.]|nr:GNAT family N-acetyltransferase [Candidatus Bipolaricaulis sp.]
MGGTLHDPKAGATATPTALTRSCRRTDRESVRGLAVRLADPRAIPACLRDHPEWVADGMTRYYTDAEPESCFVAAGDSGVVGYVFGAVSTARRDRWVAARVLPGLVLRGLATGAGFRCPLGQMLRAGLRGWRRASAAKRGLRRSHPAHLHVGVCEGARGRGVGRLLVSRFVEHAANAGAPGIHASVIASNGPARRFFEQQGFHELRRYAAAFPGSPDPVPMILFGRRLTSKQDERAGRTGALG